MLLPCKDKNGFSLLHRCCCTYPSFLTYKYHTFYSPLHHNKLYTYLIITMANPIALAFSLCFLVLFHSCLAARQQSQSRQQNECQLDQLQAHEPDNRIETEAGRIESWDYNRDDFRCAGVAVQRITIEKNGLHLPSYSHAPQLTYIVQGNGVLSTVFPGCPETFEETEQSVEEQRGQQGRGEEQQQEQQQTQHGQQGRGQHGRHGQQGQLGQERFEQLDRHQKVRRIREGDVVAIPAGVTYWSYNDGDQPLVAVNLLDIGNNQNQLDRNPRRFYLAGNPQNEFNTQGESQFRRGQQGRGQQGRGKSQWDQDQQQQGGRSRHQQQQQGNNNIFAGFNTQLLADALNIDQQTAQQLQGQNDNRPQIVRVKGRLDFIQPPQSEQEERHQQGIQRQTGQQGQNGFEETFCNFRIKENIGRPSRADVFSPQAGRISTLNSFKLPILRHLDLSAERGFFYNNAIYSPHWNLNAHEVYYVIRGSARVQVVNDNGQAILDNEVRQGQLFIVPQNHAVLQKASNNGYEYIAFKTQDNAKINTLAGRTSVLRALPDVVLANAYQIDRQQARTLKYNRQETVALGSSRSSQSQGRGWAIA
ncbi:prunin 1 Pru du 6.0101-like [Argentina anserina]|uniref:prunin 1 Pru du 6.0101-like n=1 Tax=Argentina anserina TaxID=57926 RepID=UPI0021768595|nr:prunin 1 Pru du 6.0101-like [Potentilla anserina]XP_050363142.1 prunin 1 Pru du 6.0101-like [Potentilla anserina]XP_050363143.1 prunin 1 Pru du 6.0101-like [Potentilla anserina]XP_050363144.1 prunin 1 Pru du 6.0101-like [Potentilla anserina]XP_050363145.1 prunin 1 Pru du 6.0101-like [Potentilla anserina]XP_050363146.1 prunin 1 Pru du 6.0101-like [Potentilla anserina]XP_050363147.1 prunin 1 Pru du 6.0101-like [Potentilla anserina]XP_050363149.1 prunin 1 Pru du 6.0101-like [Potentilla anser